MNNFQDDFFNQAHRRHKSVMKDFMANQPSIFRRMWKAAIAFVVLVVALWVLWYTLIAYVFVGVVGAVNENGLKGVTESVWCGKNEPNCLGSGVDKSASTK